MASTRYLDWLNEITFNASVVLEVNATMRRSTGCSQSWRSRSVALCLQRRYKLNRVHAISAPTGFVEQRLASCQRIGTSWTFFSELRMTSATRRRMRGSPRTATTWVRPSLRIVKAGTGGQSAQSAGAFQPGNVEAVSCWLGIEHRSDL